MTVEKDQLLLPKLGRLPVLEGGRERHDYPDIART